MKCNSAALWLDHGEATGPAETGTAGVMSMDGSGVFLLCVVVVTLVGCVGIYIPVSAGARRQVQRWLGMFSCFLFAMALTVWAFSVKREGEG